MSKKHVLSYLSLYLLLTSSLSAQNYKNELYWNLSSEDAIIWDLTKENKLPHHDNIELSGTQVSAIIHYNVDENKNISVEKDIIFPQLRTYNATNEPDWKKYRAYFRKKVSSNFSPTISFNNLRIIPSKVDSIEINGLLRIFYTPVEGVKITKTLFPSMDDRALVEEWQLDNIDTIKKSITISPIHTTQSEKGYKGDYNFVIKTNNAGTFNLIPRASHKFSVHYGATLNKEVLEIQNAADSRNSFLDTCRQHLVLESPNPVINQLFYFSKIRAAESIFESSMGLVHSPGGGNYYTGIWANDQVEYSGPFFPYLGYDIGNRAAYNAYKMFLKNIPQDSSHIPYAFEVDGNFAMTHLDRGDAAMIAYGCSQYLLASGNKEEAEELWPLIEWSLAYCDRKKNKGGAIQSTSDEMEGRIETGTANLSTSSLYFGGLKQSIHIAHALDKSDLADMYMTRLSDMKEVIENYFGAEVQGYKTYKYFSDNSKLRHWICLPLVMGITERKEETLKALFEKLWPDDGIRVEYDPEITENLTFWDRATLYAFRGAMKVNAIDLAYDRLLSYSKKRLLGDHVPYPVEAYPENNMKHLSAESALYCRIFTEGLLGIEPLNFGSFNITPNLPSQWNYLKLKHVYIGGTKIHISINREAHKLYLVIRSDTKNLFDGLLELNQTVTIKTD